MQVTQIHTNLLPGMFDSKVEFIGSEDGKVVALTNSRFLSISELPSSKLNKIKAKMNNHEATIEEIETFLFKNYGGVDNEPDMDESGEMGPVEYNRLTDDHSLSLGNGVTLNPCELKVLQLINHSNKEIADMLFRSEHTVATTIQNIQLKTGEKGKVELALFAKKKGII